MENYKLYTNTLTLTEQKTLSDLYDKLEGKEKEIPIWKMSNLSLEEAVAYSGIGINKLRELTNEENSSFVLWVGNKRLIKCRLFDQYIEQKYSI